MGRLIYIDKKTKESVFKIDNFIDLTVGNMKKCEILVEDDIIHTISGPLILAEYNYRGYLVYSEVLNKNIAVLYYDKTLILIINDIIITKKIDRYIHNFIPLVEINGMNKTISISIPIIKEAYVGYNDELSKYNLSEFNIKRIRKECQHTEFLSGKYDVFTNTKYNYDIVAHGNILFGFNGNDSKNILNLSISKCNNFKYILSANNIYKKTGFMNYKKVTEINNNVVFVLEDMPRLFKCTALIEFRDTNSIYIKMGNSEVKMLSSKKSKINSIFNISHVTIHRCKKNSSVYILNIYEYICRGREPLEKERNIPGSMYNEGTKELMAIVDSYIFRYDQNNYTISSLDIKVDDFFNEDVPMTQNSVKVWSEHQANNFEIFINKIDFNNLKGDDTND